MITITGGGAFTAKNISDINANFATVLPFTPGRLIWLEPASSLGSNPVSQARDGSMERPYTDLATAYGAGRSGFNDVILLVGDGTTSATARVNSSFTWAKNALHLIGVCSPTWMSQRARIAPSSTTTAFTPFFTVSASGCLFQNIQWFMGFTAGTTNQIGMIVTGSRNVFLNCHIAGLCDTDSASAADAGSRTLKIGSAGSGENVFQNCTIGVDTTTRSAANATLEFTGATTRNVFRDCIFPFMCSAATPIGLLGSGTENMDRYQWFERCLFVNAVKSTSTAMTGLTTLAASSGGMIILRYCTAIGITDLFTDATTSAQMYLDGGAPAAATSGLGVNPA